MKNAFLFVCTLLSAVGFLNAQSFSVTGVVVEHSGRGEFNNSWEPIATLEGVIGTEVTFTVTVAPDSPPAADIDPTFKLIWTNPSNPAFDSQDLGFDTLSWVMSNSDPQTFEGKMTIPYSGTFYYKVMQGNTEVQAFSLDVVDLSSGDLHQTGSLSLKTPIDGARLSVLNPVVFSVDLRPETLRSHAIVDYYVNGYKVNSTGVTSGDDGTEFSFTWDEPYIGDISVTAIAQLNNGTFVETSSAANATLVGVGSSPKVSLAMATGGEKVVGSPAQFTVQASDSNALIETVELWVNGVKVDTISGAENFPFNFDFKFPSEGPYEIWALADFSSGNRAISNILEFKVGLGSAPTVTLLSPISGMHFLPGTELPILGTAHDPNSLIRELRYFVNDTLIGTATRSEDGSFQTNLSDTGSSSLATYLFQFAGDYRIYVQGTDESGIIAQSDTVVVHVGNENINLPRVIMSHPLPVGGGDTLNDVSVGSSMFLNAIVSDAVGYVDVVKFFINGQLIGSSKTQFRDTFSYYYSPTTPGDYIIFAEAVDNHGNRSHSVPLQLIVEPLDAQLPIVEMVPLSEEQLVVDAGSKISFSGKAEGGLVDVSQLNFYVNGVLVDSVETPETGTNIYTASVELNDPGTYFLSARALEIEPLGLPTDNWVVSDPIAVMVTAGSGNRAFVLKIYRDFFSIETPQSTLDASVIALDAGQKSQAQYVYEILQDDSFENTRQALMARFLLTGEWPSRAVLLEDQKTVDALELKQLITLHLPTFQSKYWGGKRIPDGFSPTSDFEEFAKILFQNKYGQAPTDEQLDRCVFQMKGLGTELFVREFVRDNKALPFAGETISTILSIPNPPNTRLIDLADTAVLMINLHRTTPSAADVEALSGDSLITRIEKVLADPLFTSR